MIKDRRKEQVKDIKRAPKKATTADRAAGGARAKRAAATASRRGMTDSNKPNAMELEKEVYRQSRRTTSTKEKQVQKASAGRLPPKAKPKNERKKDAENTAVFAGGRPPSRKAIEAAVNGMEAAGFKVPKGMQVIITFVPAPEPTGRKPAAKKNPPTKGGMKPATNRNEAANQNQGGGGTNRNQAANQNQGGGGNQNQGGGGGGGGRGGRRSRR
jgi:hypothetical protein